MNLNKTETARELGISKAAVGYNMRRFQIDHVWPFTYRALPRVTVEEALAVALTEGLSKRETAELLGCSPRSLRESMAKYGLEEHSWPKLKVLSKRRLERDEFDRLYPTWRAENMTQSEMARVLGVSFQTVSYWAGEWKKIHDPRR